MARIILNIGLDGIQTDPSYTNGQLNHPKAAAALTAVQAVRALNFKLTPGNSRVMESSTESTLVALVDHDGDVEACTYWLAEKLNQEAIAVWWPARAEGKLIGPQAEKWGTFDPAQFLMPDGRRLSAML